MLADARRRIHALHAGTALQCDAHSLAHGTRVCEIALVRCCLAWYGSAYVCACMTTHACRLWEEASAFPVWSCNGMRTWHVARARARTCACAYVRKCIRICHGICICTLYSYIHAHTRTHTYTQTYMHSRLHVYTACIHLRTRRRMRASKHTPGRSRHSRRCVESPCGCGMLHEPISV